MKHAWFNLLVSALTDGVGAAVGGILAIFMAAQMANHPIVWSWAVVSIPILTGLGVAVRTIQETLKTTPATVPALMGVPVIETTETPTQTVVKKSGQTVVAPPITRKAK